MLIDRGIAVGEIVSLKLSTGDEIMGKLVEESDSHYKLSKPLMLSMNRDGIGMIPFMFTVDETKDLPFAKSNVITIQSSHRQYADQYIKGTTGIQMV